MRLRLLLAVPLLALTACGTSEPTPTEEATGDLYTSAVSLHRDTAVLSEAFDKVVPGVEASIPEGPYVPGEGILAGVSLSNGNVLHSATVSADTYTFCIETADGSLSSTKTYGAEPVNTRASCDEKDKSRDVVASLGEDLEEAKSAVDSFYAENGRLPDDIDQFVEDSGIDLAPGNRIAWWDMGNDRLPGADYTICFDNRKNGVSIEYVAPDKATDVLSGVC